MKEQRRLTMNEKDLLQLLIESSSLRKDLLDKVSGAIIDLLNNIELTDEIMTRVNDDTYQFVKGYKI